MGFPGLCKGTIVWPNNYVSFLQYQAALSLIPLQEFTANCAIRKQGLAGEEGVGMVRKDDICTRSVSVCPSAPARSSALVWHSKCNRERGRELQAETETPCSLLFHGESSELKPSWRRSLRQAVSVQTSGLGKLKPAELRKLVLLKQQSQLEELTGQPSYKGIAQTRGAARYADTATAVAFMS